MSIASLASSSESAAASPNLRLRKAGAADLPAVNAIVEAAMATWNSSARVLRLSLPLYRYTEFDLAHLELLVAETTEIVGVAALEMLPDDSGILLHGLYVDPPRRWLGIGTRLLQAAEFIARRHGDSLRVRSRPESLAFFEANGYRRLSQIDLGDAYPRLLSKALVTEDSSAA